MLKSVVAVITSVISFRFWMNTGFIPTSPIRNSNLKLTLILTVFISSA